MFRYVLEYGWKVWNVLSPHQKGFTPFDGVFEHNYVLQQRMMAARRSGSDLCVAWLDVSDAFGSVPHNWISETLSQRGAGEDIVEIVKDMYRGQTTFFKVPTRSSGVIHARKGIRQGCPLSGLLFNMSINHILEDLDTGPDHRVLAYADDITLLARTPEELQEQIDRTAGLLERIGMHLNPGKCKTLHISGQSPVGVRGTEFSLAGTRLVVLKEGESHRFLGHPVGFRAVPPQTSFEEVVERALKIMRSKLAPWQRLDALRSFIFPALHFTMRNGDFLKKDWERIDEILRAEIKKTLGVPQEASNDYVYGARSEGLCGIPIAAEESDIALIDGVFKLLTTTDERIRRMA